MELLTLECVYKTEWWGRTETHDLLEMGEATRYVSLEKRRLKRSKSERLLFRRVFLFLRRWEIVRRQISNEYEAILRIRSVQLNGQHQEIVSSVSEGWMAFRCKELGRWCWSLYCAPSLTGDLKGPFQVMVSHQGIMVTATLPSVQ